MSALTPGLNKQNWSDVERRTQELETALRDLFEWCSNTVPYFGEAWAGSRDDTVYLMAAKALRVDVGPRTALLSPGPGEPV